MITLNAALQTAGSALSAESTAIGITGQNLSNQTTPGYARQIVSTETDGFNPSLNLAGGVSPMVADSRSQFAEQAVWYQQTQSGAYQAFTTNASTVSQLMGLNDVSGSTGLQNSLSQLFASFSALATSPNSQATQNGVIQNAQAFAVSMSDIAQTIQQSVTSAQSQVQNTVSTINQLVGQVQQYNQQIQSGVAPGASAEAQVYSTLESLSNLVPISTRQGQNGSISILMNGTTLLLTGQKQYVLQSNPLGAAGGAAYPLGNSTVEILDSEGNDITSSFSGGQLGGLIHFVNDFAPSLVGNGSQQGALNQLAQGVADSVNATLGGAKPLFQYGPGGPTADAQTLAINSSFTSADLSNALTANPNAAANLSQVAAGNTAATQINGESFANFLNTTAGGTASTINAQQSGLELHGQLLAQAQANRSQVQGVSLETESVNLLQYQQAFQASSQLISVINTLMQSAINMAVPLT
jgi:flagellar hook-associated protein 1 FlgK